MRKKKSSKKIRRKINGRSPSKKSKASKVAKLKRLAASKPKKKKWWHFGK